MRDTKESTRRAVELSARKGATIKVVAMFERYGMKGGRLRPRKTVLLSDVYESNGGSIAKHVWIEPAHQFERLNLRYGDMVSFDANVRDVLTGYLGPRTDLFYRPVELSTRLTNPRQVRLETPYRNSREIVATMNISEGLR